LSTGPCGGRGAAGTIRAAIATAACAGGSEADSANNDNEAMSDVLEGGGLITEVPSTAPVALLSGVSAEWLVGAPMPRECSVIA